MSAEAKYRITAVDNTKAATASVMRNLSGLTRAAGGLKAQLAAAVAGISFGAAIKESLDYGGQVADLSKRLGVSTEALSEYRHVADQTGTSLQAIAKSWQQMAKNISDAAVGTGSARDALRDLGLSAADLMKITPDEQFEAIAESMSKVGGQADRVALAMAIFGKSGAEMLQSMGDGAEGLRALRAEANAMGLTLNAVDAEKLDAAGDAMTRMKLSGQKLGQDLAITLAPTIETIANWLADHLPFAVGYTVKAFHKARGEILESVAWITTHLATLMHIMSLIPGQTGEHFEDVLDALQGIRDKSKEWALGAKSDYEQATVQLQSMAEALRQARDRVAALGLGGSDAGADFERLGDGISKATAALEAHVEAYREYLEHFEEMRGPQDAHLEDFARFKEQQEEARAALEAGIDMSADELLEYGSGWVALGEMVQMAGQLAGEGLGNFIDATVAAIGGSRRSFAEMGKAVLKWAADTVKGLAVTAAAKALYYKAEAMALASNPFTAALAPAAAAAAGAYGMMAAAAGGLAIALGAVSAANAPTGSFMSQQERESTSGLAVRDESGYGDENTYSRGALTAANMTVTHIYNGPVYFGSQDLASAAGIQRVIDSGELYFQGSQ